MAVCIEWRGLSGLILGGLLMALPAAAAEVRQIPGPAGPLEGELLTVPGADHLLVIVPGSGPIDRDGNAPALGLASDSYRLLAEGLAERGIASIRIDKRGFFGSSAAIADPNEVTVAAYAADARAWVEATGDLASCVWLAGHSEGGLVALAAAAEAPPEGLCGLILLSTSGRPMGRLLVEQMRDLPAMTPLLSEIESIVTGLEAGQTRDSAEISPALRWLFSPGLQRYMIDAFAYDPLALARHWQGPVIILQGDRDLQVKPLDADLLAEAMAQAERSDLVGATHMLKSDRPGEPLATYRDPALALHPDLVRAIADFLGRHVPE